MITAGAGGAADFAARIIAAELAGSLGQQVIVENRGGTANNRTLAVVNAPPDGYTLLLASSSTWLLPFMQKVAYDPIQDLSPISLAVKQPLVLVVHPSLPIKSIRELIALAKSRPGELNYASGAGASSNQLAAALFNALAHVNIVLVPYKDTAQGLNDVIAGHVQLQFSGASSTAAHIKSGRLRALAVTSAQPSALLSGLPTVAASGVPGFEAGTTTGIFGPVGVPAAIIMRLNQEIARVLNLVSVKERFLSAGSEAVSSSPEQLAASIKSEMAETGKVIRDNGIRAD